MDNKNILIIEDSELTASIIKDYLEKEEYTVYDVAANYGKTQSIYKEHLPEIIICDIHINGERSGIEIIEEIRKTDNLVVIVYISSDTKDNVILKAQQTIPEAYLTKPFTSKQLVTTLKMAVAKKL